MGIADWEVLGLDSFFGRVEQEAEPQDQMRAVLQIRDVIREEKLHRIVLDMDHADEDLNIDIARFNAKLLADEVADAGLKRFALVHRDQLEPWWDHLLASLVNSGVEVRDFTQRGPAVAWVKESDGDGENREED